MSADTAVAEFETQVKSKFAKIELVDRRAEVASKIGVEKSEIKSVSMQLEVLRKQGILVDLSISGTSMFTRSTSWVEIGIQEDDDDVRTQRFTRGRKHLIPEKEIKKLHSVETSMRGALDYFGQDITGFRPYRWIPFTAYNAWRERWNELSQRFDEVKDMILTRYDEFVDDLQKDFADVAEASWASIRKQGYQYAIVKGKAYDEFDFKRMIIDDAMAKLPTKVFIEQNLHADYVTALVYGMEDYEADRARAEAIKAQSELEQTKVQAEKDKAYAEAQMAFAKDRHQRDMQTLELQEKEAKIEAMWKAEIAHAREQLGAIVSPFEEVFRNLRNRFAEDASDMLASIQKNGLVRGKVAEKERGLVDLFDMWATHDDSELRAKLIDLKRAIGPDMRARADDAPERSTAEVTAILEQISDLAHKASKDLQAGPSRFSMIE